MEIRSRAHRKESRVATLMPLWRALNPIWCDFVAAYPIWCDFGALCPILVRFAENVSSPQILFFFLRNLFISPWENATKNIGYGAFLACSIEFFKRLASLGFVSLRWEPSLVIE